MDINIAIAHLHMLGFIPEDSFKSKFINPSTGLRVLCITYNHNGAKNYWIHSLLTRNTQKTMKIVNFLNES